jgi:hypothetical protein
MMPSDNNSNAEHLGGTGDGKATDAACIIAAPRPESSVERAEQS